MRDAEKTALGKTKTSEKKHLALLFWLFKVFARLLGIAHLVLVCLLMEVGLMLKLCVRFALALGPLAPPSVT